MRALGEDIVLPTSFLSKTSAKPNSHLEPHTVSLPLFHSARTGALLPRSLAALGAAFHNDSCHRWRRGGERPSPRHEEGVSREGGPGDPAPAARGCPGREAGLAARRPRPRRGASAVPAAGGAGGQRSGAARGGAGRAAGAAGGLPRGGGSRSGLYNAGARRATPLRPR